jgi:hypothetical protein
MTEAQPTPSQRIKTLWRKNGPGDDGISLKDFAVNLAQNGTKDEKTLVDTWLGNKARRSTKKAPPPAPAPVAVSKGKPIPQKKR